MTYDELKDKIEDIEYWQEQYAGKTFIKALRAVIELHKPDYEMCMTCEMTDYPCKTIKCIEKVFQEDTTHLVEPNPGTIDTIGIEVLN